MSTGDTGDLGVSSMNPNNDNGKILRFNLDGSIPRTIQSVQPRVQHWPPKQPRHVSRPQRIGVFQRTWSIQLRRIQHPRSQWKLWLAHCGGDVRRHLRFLRKRGDEVSYCESNNVIEPFERGACAAVNDLIYYDHPAIPEWQGVC